jgi:hypothetical protein
MKAIFRRRALMALPAALASLALGRGGQSPAAQAGADRQSDGPRLPNGKLQRDEILKAEYEQNLKDAARLVEMAEDLKQELEKNERFVLSMSTLKKTDDIEKLVRRIRSRLRH